MTVLERLSAGKITHDVEALEAEYQQDRGVAASRKKLDEAFAHGRQKLREKSALRFSDTMPDGEAEVAIGGAKNSLDEAERMAGAAIAPRVRLLHAAAANRVGSTLKPEVKRYDGRVLVFERASLGEISLCANGRQPAWYGTSIWVE